MVALSCGIDAETLGSLMTLASGRVHQLAELGEVVADPLLGGQGLGEGGEHAARQRDVAQLDLHAGDAGEGVHHRQQRPRGQRRGLVGVRVDDRVAVFDRVTRHERVIVGVSGRPPRWRGPPGRSPAAPPPRARPTAGRTPRDGRRRRRASCCSQGTARSFAADRRPAQRTGVDPRAPALGAVRRSSRFHDPAVTRSRSGRDAARCARRPRSRCGTASRWWWDPRRRRAA